MEALQKKENSNTTTWQAWEKEIKHPHQWTTKRKYFSGKKTAAKIFQSNKTKSGIHIHTVGMSQTKPTVWGRRKFKTQRAILAMWFTENTMQYFFLAGVSLISLIMKLSWNPSKAKTALDLLQFQKDILSDLNDKDDEKTEAEMGNPQLNCKAVRLAMEIRSISEVNCKCHLDQVCGPYYNQAVVLMSSQILWSGLGKKKYSWVVI